MLNPSTVFNECLDKELKILDKLPFFVVFKEIPLRGTYFHAEKQAIKVNFLEASYVFLKHYALFLLSA